MKSTELLIIGMSSAILAELRGGWFELAISIIAMAAYLYKSYKER